MTRSAQKALAAGLFYLGLVFVVAGFVYGLQSVKVAPDSDGCGNGFSYETSFSLTTTGDEACAQEQSNRQANTWGLMGAGLAGVVLAGFIAMSARGSAPKQASPAGAESGT